MSEQLTELQKLADVLCGEAASTEIDFREESAREIRYTLVVGCHDNALLKKLALTFGCDEDDLPESLALNFEAYDWWHGNGSVDLRKLADEFMQTEGEFFDFTISVAEIHKRAWNLPVAC